MAQVVLNSKPKHPPLEKTNVVLSLPLSRRPSIRTKVSHVVSGGTVNRVVEIPAGDRVATGSSDGVVRLYNASTGQLLREFRGQGTPVGNLVALGGNLIACLRRGSPIGKSVPGPPVLDIQSVDEDEPLSSLTISSWVISALGEGLLVQCVGADIVVMRHSNGRALEEVRRRNGAHTWAIKDVSCCSGRIATVSWDKTVHVWDAETLAPLAKIEGHPTVCAALMLTSQHIISVASDFRGNHLLRIYDAKSFLCDHVITLPLTLEGDTFNTCKVALVNTKHCIAFSTRTACIVDMDSGTIVARLRTGIEARHGTVLHDGRLAVAGRNGKAKILEVKGPTSALFRSGAAARDDL